MADRTPDSRVDATMCEMCDKDGTVRCAGCRISRYCSKSCQKKGWKAHKSLCTSFKGFADDKRPGHNYRRAIYFPNDADEARFVWLPFEERATDGGVTLELPQHGNLLGEDDPVTEFRSASEVTQRIITRMGKIVNGKVIPTLTQEVQRSFDHRLIVQYRNAIFSHKDKPSPVVHKLVGNVQAQDWCGPMVFFAKGSTTTTCRDLDPQDLQLILYVLKDSSFRTSTADLRYEKLLKQSQNSGLARGQVVHGVRINCNGDKDYNHRPKFESVVIPASHSILKTAVSPPISTALGLPLHVSKLPHDRSYAGLMKPFMVMPWSNPTAAILHRQYDISSHTRAPSLEAITGCAVIGHPMGEGSVIHVRADRKPLRPEHLESMIDFIEKKMQPKVMRAFQMKEGEDKELARLEVLGFTNKENFRAYYREWQAQRREEGVVVQDLTFGTD